MLEVFASVVPLFLQYGYWFMVGGAFIEGFNMMILAGFLSSLGHFSVWFSLLAVVVGHALSGYAWYAVGYNSGAPAMEKWGSRIRLTPERQMKVKEYFARYSGRTILITKFTFALTIATLIFAGSMRMNLKRFSLWNVLGSFGWGIITIFLGFTFGESYKLVQDYITNIGIAIAFIAGAGILLFFLRQIVKRRFVRKRVDKFWAKVQELRTAINGEWSGWWWKDWNDAQSRRDSRSAADRSARVEKEKRDALSRPSFSANPLEKEGPKAGDDE